MVTSSYRTNQRSQGMRGSMRRPRRGVALVFVLVFVIAMAALAMSSIFMASNANLLAKSYDRERDLKYAAEAALAIGKSRVNADPSILTMRSAGQLDTAILLDYTLTGADGNPLRGIKVNVYVGPSGSTSGQFGRFSSIVAEAREDRNGQPGNGFIRRLELTQESFAKFAYWSNSESNTSSKIFFNNGDVLFGPVWSNDTIFIGNGRATFRDDVGTAFFVSGSQYGTFAKGFKQFQRPIPLPSTSTLTTLATIAAASGWDLPAQQTASQIENNVRDRIEFIAMDVNNDTDSLDVNEGTFRYFTAGPGRERQLRGDWPTAFNPARMADLAQCGDWHWVRTPGTSGGSVANTSLAFFPGSVHSQGWFRAALDTGYRDRGMSNSAANAAATADQVVSVRQMMTSPNARCYLAGDSHLVATERSNAYTDPRTGSSYAVATYQKGGSDTTFTPVGVNGSWRQWSNTPDSVFTRVRGYAGAPAGSGKAGDAKYLFPLDRLFNANAKGVIHVNGNVGLSGTLNGRITLYANGSIVLLDDVRYANDPVTVTTVCRDILGLISDLDIVIADNAINTPQNLNGAGTPSMSNLARTVDDTPDIDIHGVMMALGTSFRVQNYNAGPTNVNGCGTTSNGRGCIALSGGLIQQQRGPVGTSGGTGFAKRYSYDRCAVMNPPPYFPTTGRFQENRYLELDPAGFNHLAYFQSITPGP